MTKKLSIFGVSGHMTETRIEHKVSVGMNKGKRAPRIRNRIQKDNTNMDPEVGPGIAQSVQRLAAGWTVCGIESRLRRRDGSWGATQPPVQWANSSVLGQCPSVGKIITSYI
jgi:hypothetical protein